MGGELKAGSETIMRNGASVGSEEPSDGQRAGSLAGYCPRSSLPRFGPALSFIPYQVGKYLEVFKALLAQGVRNFTIQGCTPEAKAFLKQVNKFQSRHEFELHGFGKELKETPIDGLPVRAAVPSPGAVFLFLPSGPALSSALMDYVGAQNVVLCAPITEHHFTRRPLLIQSIPKSGTHLLVEVAKAMGYGLSPTSADLPDELLPGHFYNLWHLTYERLGQPYSRIWRLVEAIATSPVTFIYRDPRDVAVSMTHYLVKQPRENPLLSAYMKTLSPAERLSAVISGDYPIPISVTSTFSFRGTIRDLMMAYSGWLTHPFGNVIPLSFEDVVGSAGGGDEQAQLKALWRLQLALHVPGRPGDFVQGIFNKKSATFRKGQIGSYREEFGDEHYRRFQTLPQDFMQIYGYGDAVGPGDQQAKKECTVSLHRHRTELSLEAVPVHTAYLLEEGYRGFNIVRFEQQCIGVAQELGEIQTWPVPQESVVQWATQGKWIVGKSCNEVRAAIDDRRFQGMEARLRVLEDRRRVLEDNLRQGHAQVQQLLDNRLAVRIRRIVRHPFHSARRLIETVIPLSRLGKLFSRYELKN